MVYVSDSTDPDQRFGCFLLQAHAVQNGADQHIGLVLEDVATGAKQRFATPEELQCFLYEWARSGSGRAVHSS